MQKDMPHPDDVVVWYGAVRYFVRFSSILYMILYKYNHVPWLLCTRSLVNPLLNCTPLLEDEKILDFSSCKLVRWEHVSHFM